MKTVTRSLLRITIFVTLLAIFAITSIGRDYYETTLSQFHRESLGTVRDLGLFFRNQVLTGAVEAIPNYVEEISVERNIVSFWIVSEGADFNYERLIGKGKPPTAENFSTENSELEYFDDSDKKIYFVKQKIFYAAAEERKTHEAAQLIYGFSYKKIIEQIFFIWLKLLFIIISIIVFSFALYRYFKKRMTRSFNFFIKNFGQLVTGELSNKNISDFDDFKPIIALGESMAKKIANFQLNEKNSAVEIELGRLASQVSHDIRSPLAALEMILSSAGDFSGDRQMVIRNAILRIKDIANTLLSQVKKENHHELIATQKNSLELHYLVPLIDSILTEKRIQNRDKIDVSIDLNHSLESYGLFVNVDSVELKRIISNLIDNSIDSFNNSIGKVLILVESINSKRINIRVRDDGRGIPDHVLPQLGVKGFSFRKENGNGLGLNHAKNHIEAWGGTLSIHSPISKDLTGTEVAIELSSAYSPAWFVPKLNLHKKQKIVIYDDDQTIHQIWDGRFKDNLDQVSIVHLTNYASFKEFYGKNFVDLEDALFLIDYEIHGENNDGLFAIKEFGIQMQSVLVTSRYEEAHIRERCEFLGVKMIPKPMCGFVPIEIN